MPSPETAPPDTLPAASSRKVEAIRRPSPGTVAIIGAGPAGLAAAEVLAAAGAQVAVYDAMPSPARKFLMAGRGGLNLTHSEPFETFVTRYGPASAALRPALEAFPPEALRLWAAGLGEATFVGSSGRVFPRSFKASPLLRAWLRRLAAAGVTLHGRHSWEGWTAEGALAFATPGGPVTVPADAVILALGGASWPRLGSTGSWAALLRKRGLEVRDFAPANMGLRLSWSEPFRTRFAGAPLKRIALGFAGRRVAGEALVTETGLEGGAVYTLSGAIREALARGPVSLAVDLRPDLSQEDLATRLAKAPGSLSFANLLRRAAGLSPVAAGLLREAGAPPRDPGSLAARIKALPLVVTGTEGLARAISSAGGLAFNALDADFAVKGLPGVFVAGEMLDFEAPTGGYLLQAAFSTGRAAGEGALRFLGLAAPQPEKPPVSR